jgi:hypothetical protein
MSRLATSALKTALQAARGARRIRLDDFAEVTKLTKAGDRVRRTRSVGTRLEVEFASGAKVKVNPFKPGGGAGPAFSGKARRQFGPAVETVKGRKQLLQELQSTIGSGRQTRLVSREGEGLLKAAARTTRQGFISHPITAGAGTLLGATVVGRAAGEPLGEAIVTDVGGRTQQLAGAIEFQTRQQMLLQERIQRIQELKAQQLARLAGMDPHLYNQLRAGRLLPRGGRMFGNVDRVDALDQVAGAMLEGRFANSIDLDPIGEL